MIKVLAAYIFPAMLLVFVFGWIAISSENKWVADMASSSIYGIILLFGFAAARAAERHRNNKNKP